VDPIEVRERVTAFTRVVINRLQAKINHKENLHMWQEKIANLPRLSTDFSFSLDPSLFLSTRPRRLAINPSNALHCYIKHSAVPSSEQAIPVLQLGKYVSKKILIMRELSLDREMFLSYVDCQPV
jgi:hypothetical protein